MNTIKLILGLLVITTLISCSGDKKKPIYVDTDNVSEETENSSYAQNGDEVVVPFRNENGVKYVQVKVNGVGFEMIFDTGCSGALISVAEANYLYQKGYLTQDDIIGVTQSQIADGSIVENMVINLKEVIIDGKIRCTDVTATVSSNNNAPLLLGNEVLNRVAAYAVDNENKTINFKLK